ncbi:MAG: DUF6075 family protein [Ethanoligenens sp.]
MKFRNKYHQEFYEQMIIRAGCAGDHYREALFYTLGIIDETRRHIGDLYDFTNHCPNFRAWKAAWQTSSSTRVTRLAFNLYNGFNGGNARGHDSAAQYTPYEIFCDALMPWMFEAVKLLYPQHVDSNAWDCKLDALLQQETKNKAERKGTIEHH